MNTKKSILQEFIERKRNSKTEKYRVAIDKMLYVFMYAVYALIGVFMLAVIGKALIKFIF